MQEETGDYTAAERRELENYPLGKLVAVVPHCRSVLSGKLARITAPPPSVHPKRVVTIYETKLTPLGFEYKVQYIVVWAENGDQSGWLHLDWILNP